MKLAYVSGKYSTNDPVKKAEYIEISRKVARALWSLGVAAISPHLNTANFDDIADYETFMEGDFIQVERSNLIVMLSNWRDSSGAIREREHAIARLVAVFEWDKDLARILCHCWPRGIPEKYLKSSKLTLTPEEYEIVANHTTCPE